MLNNIINEISTAYITEAQHSPFLMEDMAAMEKYMAESYSDRVFIELIQNADDCGSTGILVQQYKNHLIFANNGRPFDENDIISISRSGASKKERGSQIGYRGIGFKSTSYLTEEILIYSNDTLFTFSKSECSKRLGKPKEKLPTVRIPFAVSSVDSELYHHILDVSKDFNTVFVFKDAKIDQFINEIGNLSTGYFMFLKNICSCAVQMADHKCVYNINRKVANGNEILTFESGKQQQWLIIRGNGIALAMQLFDGKIVACESNESIYHCFLPTLDTAPYPFKINADFSTDPSRKHITQDSITTEAIERIALLIYETLEKAVEEENPMFSNLFDMITSVSSFSPINQKLTNSLENLIKNNLCLKCSDGKRKPISSFKTFPDYFENSEKNVMRLNSPSISEVSIDKSYYDVFPSIMAFVEKYSQAKFSFEEIAQTLTEKAFVESLDSQMYARIFAFVAASARIAKITNKGSKLPNDILIPTNKGAINTKEITRHDVVINDEVKSALFENTRGNDLETFCEDIGIKSDALREVDPVDDNRITIVPNANTIVPLKKPVVSKWRSAEQQCVELETFWGNTAVDVSKQNVGYDIESTRPDGTKRFIEVKLISNSGGAFSLTNNEYTAAHQHGENYFICLVFQREHTAEALYINNPLQSIRLEKRVRQWEWYCEEYSGEKHEIDLK